MKKLLILGLFIAFVTGSVNATVTSSKNDIIGTWNYEAPTAPYGYEKGKFIFAEEEGVLTGVIQFADGTKIELNKPTFEENLLKCSIYLEGSFIGIAAKVEGESLTGTVDTPEGKLELKAEKAE